MFVRYNKLAWKFGNSDHTYLSDDGKNIYVYSGWFHWAIVVRNAKNFEYYVNGKKLWNGTKTGNNNKLQWIKQAAEITYQVGGTAGYADEIRILNVAPTEEYIKAEYDSINNKQFVVASPAEKNGYGLSVIVR